MTFEDFEKTLDESKPPKGLSPLVRALWLAKKGDWDGAHDIVSDDGSSMAARIHAHLHRVEGDLGNARYWYGNAGVKVETGTLDAEWEKLAREVVK